MGKKNGDFSFEFFDSVSTSIVVGTKDVYVIRGIVSQGSKLSKILRTTKTTTKKSCIFLKNKEQTASKSKKKFIPTINQQQKNKSSLKKNTKKIPSLFCHLHEKKSKCYKKTKTKQKFFLFICCCLKKRSLFISRCN